MLQGEAVDVLGQNSVIIGVVDGLDGKMFLSIQIIELDCAISPKVDKQLLAVEAKRGGYVENTFNKSYFILSKEVMFKFSLIFIKN